MATVILDTNKSTQAIVLYGFNLKIIYEVSILGDMKSIMKVLHE
jgi:hypothetical protein